MRSGPVCGWKSSVRTPPSNGSRGRRGRSPTGFSPALAPGWNASTCELFPGVQGLYTQRLEIRDVPGDDRHCVDQRRGCDESIPIRSRIGNMERSTTTGHGGIDREYATGERRQNVPVQPPAENGSLRRVTTRKPQHALLQLQDGDHREKETRGGDASRPRQHSLIDPGGFRPAQLGDDVGVDQDHDFAPRESVKAAPSSTES